MRPQQPEVDGTYRRKTTGLQLTLKNREVIRATSFQNPVKPPPCLIGRAVDRARGARII